MRGRVKRGLERVALAAVAPLLAAVASFMGSAWAIAQSTPVPVDNQMRVTYTGFVLNRATSTFDTVATLSNIGTTPVLAPMSLVITGISANSVQLANAAGTTATGLPYLSLPLANGRLNPGASLTPVVLKFSNPKHVPFTFTQSIYGVVGSSNHPPTANAGADQTVDLGATVPLDGTRSTDIDGNTLTYRWTLVTIPANSHAVLANPTAVDPSFIADVAGAYTVQLIANDGQSDSLPATVVISTTNSRPVADAGPNRLVASGTNVRLDGTHSTDVDGDPLTYGWTLVSMPAGSQAALDDPTSVNPGFVADKPGTYQAQLVVNDGHADSTLATVTISTLSVPPIANAGSDQAVVVSGHVQLDGSKSSAANGGALTYRWALITLPSGSTATLATPATVNPTLTVDKAGVYTAQLIVNDGQSDSAPSIVVISTGNIRPVADAGANQAAQVGQAVVLDGSGSHDANGDALSFAWALLLKPAGSAATLGNADQAKATLTCDVPGTFIAQLIVSDDELDSVPSTTTVTVSVAPPNHDPHVTSSPVTTGQVAAAYSYQVAATDQDGDSLTYALSVSPAGMNISANGLITWNPNSAGSFPVTVRVTDGHGGSATQSFNVIVGSGGLPPDPSTVAPPLDPTGANSLFAATSFLYSGPNPIQTGVVPGTIDLKRVSILRGKVADSSGAALTGVEISIVAHPEFGHTLSRLDGVFDMAANGGARLTVRYAKAGYLPAQRQVQTNWQEFTILPDVVLLQRDPQVTTVNFGVGLASMQIARGSAQTDGDGSRQATVLLPAGTTAALVQPDGSTLPAAALNIRLTEYTVGSNGPKAMPGDLPPTSTYTYAVELGADEAVAKVNGRDVVFNQPVIFYVENFMRVPVGQIVPVGFYDPAQSTWIGGPNGRVIKLLGVTGGLADLDVDGDGIADTGAALTTLGITTAERTQLAALYAPGTSLWRTPMDHFSTNDQNWSFVCVPTDCGPPKETPPPPPPADQCTQGGSIIGCERQTLGKDVEITGTPFTLHYESDRVPGRIAEQGLLLSLASNGIPNGVKSMQVEIFVAGQRLTQTVPANPGASSSFTWDGKDAYGRTLNGSFPVTTRIGYTYDIVASAAITVPSSWARFSGIPLSVNAWRTQITLYQENTTQITRQDQRGMGLGGWSLSVLHAYDPTGHVLNLGDGTRRDVDQLTSNVVGTIAGDGTSTFAGDGVSALKSGIASPLGITVGPDRSVYIVDGGAHRVTRVDPSGIVRTVAGTGVRGFNGDGVQGNQAQLANPTSVALGLDGSVYISDRSNFRVRRVGPDGVISTFVGTGVMGVPDEGALANATAIFPRNVAVGPDGRVFISDARRIWVVDQNGVINAYAGSPALTGGDGGPALQAGLASPAGMAFSSDGALFFVDNDRIRKVTPQGIISTVAGPGNGVFSGDGGPALSAGLEQPRDVALGRDGSIYIAAVNRVRRVGTNGIINAFTGNGAAAPFLDDGPGPQTAIAGATGVAAGPDQAIYVADAGHHRIRRIAPALPGFAASDLLVPSEDGTELYVFTGEGRHQRTIKALTGTTLLEFTYDVSGYPLAVTDGDGNVTTIERSGALPTAIIAPGGQRTTLQSNADGWLSQVVNPAGQARAMTYTADGLLIQMTDARGNASRFTYDAVGRLIKDQDPAGGFTSLARTEQSNGYTVTSTSALGRTRVFQVQRNADASLARTLTSRDGTKTAVVTAADGTETTTDPDGTVSVFTYKPDPRWGMLAPVASSKLTTPSGLSRVVTVVDTVALANPADPLSMTSFQDTLTVNNLVSTTTFDAATRLATATSPLGRNRKFTADVKGRVIQEQVSGLAPISFTYNAFGKVSAITENNGVRTTAFAYNSGHDLQSITNSLGQAVNFQHDAAGRTVQQQFADGATVGYTYDATGNLTAVTPPGKAAHGFAYTAANQTASYAPPPIGNGIPPTQYVYDLDGALTHIGLPDGRSIDLSYDFAGRVQALSIARGQLAYSYHPVNGTLSGITAPGGIGLSFSYDGPLLTGAALTGPVAGTANFAYDKNFRLVSETVNGSAINFSYDADGLLISAGTQALVRDSRHGLLTRSTLGNLVDTFSYNVFAELTSRQASYSGAAVYNEALVRDAIGRVTQKTETVGGATTAYAYTYDVAGRLTAVAVNGANAANYVYDANGNRTAVSRPPSVGVAAAFDAQDRLVTFGNINYTYTSGGELLSRSVGNQVTTYQYDEFGKLTAVTLPGGASIDYLVDGMNRRVGKKMNGSSVQGFVYRDGFRPVAELNGAGALLSRFVYADDGNVPAYLLNGGNTYRIITDHLNSPRLVINVATGAIAQRMDYDEFGVVTNDTNPGFQPFGFAGGIYDRDTRLTHFGARDYDAEAGRWTTKDPLGFKAGDTNLYAYAVNNPVTYRDPNGLDEDATIECRGGQYQIVPGDSVGDINEDCTKAHEGEHVNRRKEVFGPNSCAGVKDGTLPHNDQSLFGMEGMKYEDFVNWSESRAWLVDVDCQKKKIEQCGKGDAKKKKQLQDRLKKDMNELTKYQRKVPNGKGYPGFGDINSRM